MADADEAKIKLLERARRALGVEASPATAELLTKRLESLAAEFALEWIVGDRRFETQTQQTEFWLNRLYEEIFVDEQPDAALIYARLGLALPKAQYLTRLLAARRHAQWRVAARTELLQALSAVDEKAGQAVDKGAAATQRFELGLSRAAYDEMSVQYDLAAAAAGPVKPAPPRRMSASPKVVWFSLTAEVVVSVLAALKGMEK